MSLEQKDRRQLKSVLINSSAQLRLFAPFAVLLALNIATWVFTYWKMTSPASTRGAAEIVEMQAIHLVASKAVLYGFCGIVVSAILTFVFWLKLSHRIFGPEVPMLRQLDRMIAGDFSQRIRLRRKDEWVKVADRLNTLADH